ncbi:MAG: hypothetical protein DMG67_01390, partial [Acidobacteria bacterium]
MVSTGQPQAAATPDLAVSTTAESEAPAPKISWVWHLLNFSPALLLVWFVSRFSVKIPVLDEWWLSYVFHAVRLGTATFNDFFAQHNEHRLFFPRLIWTSLAFATGWNIKAELALNVLLVVIVFAIVYQIALRQAQRIGSALFNLANLSSSLFIFSLTQYETWLLGVMGAVLLVHASVAFAIGVCFIQRLHPWTRFVLAAVFCFVASFSMMQGLASWIALLPCITLLPKESRSGRKLYLWCFLFASSVVIYFCHFRFSPGRDILRFLHHPLQAGGFFVALMGNSFCQSDAIVSGPIALVTGAAILLGLGAYVTMLRGESKEIIAPWLSLALFGFFYAAMVT